MSRAPRRAIPIERAPGPAGVLVQICRYQPRIWRFEGWPANDNKPRGAPSLGTWPNADAYYNALEKGWIQR